MNLLDHTQLLTVDEVADILRQTPRTVRDKIAAGTIAEVTIGDGPKAPIRIEAAELERFLYGSPPGAPNGRGGSTVAAPPAKGAAL
jgi:excisionase family DNA binding protein